jgi:hypothetical protein
MKRGIWRWSRTPAERQRLERWQRHADAIARGNVPPSRDGTARLRLHQYRRLPRLY